MTNITQIIRELNDRFRKGDTSVSGQVVFTRGINDLLEEQDKTPEDLVYHVRTSDSFTDENDLSGEHDFGSFDFQGEKCFWKID